MSGRRKTVRRFIRKNYTPAQALGLNGRVHVLGPPGRLQCFHLETEVRLHVTLVGEPGA